MKELNEEEAKKMTNNEVMEIVCQGLAEVCEKMADDGHYSRLQEKDLIQYASEFKAFSRLYRARANANREKSTDAK